MANHNGGVPLVGDTPAVEGIAHLYEQLDDLAARRPRGNPRLPCLLFRGGLAEVTVEGYKQRLVVNRRETVPHILCKATKPRDDDIALFDEIVNGFCKAMPRGTRGPLGLRLPRYWTIRHVLDARLLSQTNRTKRRRELRDQLYARVDALGAPAGWVSASSRWLQKHAKVGFIARPALVISKQLYTLRLRIGLRFRWFNQEIAGVTGAQHDFLDSALTIVQQGTHRDKDHLVRRVLMLAVLRDLQAASRPNPLSIIRFRRVRPFVVLLQHVVPDSPGHQFVTTLDGIGHEMLRRHTLMVLASLDPSCSPDCVPAEKVQPRTLRETAKKLAPLVERGQAPEEPTLLVEVPPNDAQHHNEDDFRWLQVNQFVQPMPWNARLALPAVSWLGVVVGAGFVLWRVGLLPLCSDDPDSCPISDRDGERIGVGDATAECSFFADAGDEVVEEMASVEQDIAEENADVLDSHQPYGTIVFFAPLTVPVHEPERLNENALNQLRGILLAQRQANDLAEGDENKALTRVLIANPGDRFRLGDDVAEQIIARATEDESIIGVVGISQSRDDSENAVRMLGDADLPVVAGPVTGDQMIDSSRLYFQVSPRNHRVAQMLVDFSTTTTIATAGNQTVTAHGAVIVLDHTDAYSQNLADDLSDEFGAGDVDTISYPIEKPDDPLPDRPPDVRVTSLDELAMEVCASLDPGDVIYYASRSAQFEGMLESMHDNNDCPDSSTVVAGSALTKLIENRADLMSEHPGLQLFYAAFASRDISFNRSTDEFIRLYDDAYGSATNGDVSVGSDVSDAALTYDAFTALQRTSNYARSHDFSISARTSAQALRDDQVEFDGATGYIALGDDALNSAGDGFQRVPPEKPVVVLQATEGQPALVLACGRFGQEDNRTGWGPANRACPTDN